MKRQRTKTTRDQYLRRKFHITEEEFNTAFAAQGSVCKTCGRPPGTRSLHVDHDHTIERHKIDVLKIAKGSYRAWPRGFENQQAVSRLAFEEYGTTRAEAKAKVKARLMRLSVRGILCWPCNKGLKVFNDNPVALSNAAQYLDDYYDFVHGAVPENPNFKGLQ